MSRLTVIVDELEREVASINASMRKRVEARRYRSGPRHPIEQSLDTADSITRRVLTHVINAIKKAEEP